MNEESEALVENKAARERAQALVSQRQRNYRETFDPASESNLAVMQDLAEFCRANSTTFHMDARAHSLAEGRREVWLRIQEHLNMDTQELWTKVFSRKGR